MLAPGQTQQVLSQGQVLKPAGRFVIGHATDRRMKLAVRARLNWLAAWGDAAIVTVAVLHV
jgi:hypothetical protein